MVRGTGASGIDTGDWRSRSLGVYPHVSLKLARARRDAARALLTDGVDPAAKRKAEKDAQADSFQAIAQEWLSKRGNLDPGTVQRDYDRLRKENLGLRTNTTSHALHHHLGRAADGLQLRTQRAVNQTIPSIAAREQITESALGGRDLKAVGQHLNYLSRDGEVEIETDDGRRLSGQGVEQELLEDWDLDLEEARRTRELRSRPGMTRPKLVHKIVFSMPPGTPPEGLLRGAQAFARETFAAKHRYAMVLHTDEPHLHVHMVVKAVSEEGVRLNIRKATLREWRREFARHLRAQGISANATDKAVRGATRANLSNGMYRAMQRGASRRIREQVGATGMEQKTASSTHCLRSAPIESYRCTRRDAESVSRLSRNLRADGAELRLGLPSEDARTAHDPLLTNVTARFGVG